jgi:hypothetical protein
MEIYLHLHGPFFVGIHESIHRNLYDSYDKGSFLYGLRELPLDQKLKYMKQGILYFFQCTS